MLGQTIANYRLTSLLAQERGTAIYAGADVRDERAVAVVVWQGERSENAMETPRSEERGAASTLAHPNIARVFEAGTWDQATPYRVMEPLDGETLAARLRVQACVRVPEALAIAREVASALEAAHAAGFVHGQLTPASVFINLDPTSARGERVKLLDLRSGPTAPGERRTDCRVLGGLLFEMLCGVAPSLVEEAAEATRSAPVVPAPSSLNPDVPEALDRLILAALAAGKGSGQGLGSLSDLRKALDSLAGGPASDLEKTQEAAASHGTSAFDVPPVALPAAPVTPVVAARPTWGLRVPPFLRFRPPARMLAGVALVGLVIGLSMFARRSHVPRPVPPRLAAAALPSAPAAPPAPVQTVAPTPLEVHPDAPAPPPAVEPVCTLSLGSQPSSEIFIDGKSTGRHTPLLRHKIPCGRRVVTLRNAELGLAKSIFVTVKPGSPRRKVVRLAPPATALRLPGL